MVSPDRQIIVQSLLFPSLSKRGGRLASIRQTTHPRTPEEQKQGLVVEVVENNPLPILDPKYEQLVQALDEARTGQEGYFNTVKLQFTPHKKKKGEQDNPNILKVNAQPSTYARVLALNKSGIPASIRNEAVSGGEDMMWITREKNGKRYLIFEERSPHSQINPRVAGPIGGGLDGKLTQIPGQQPILANATPEVIIEQGKKERREELGFTEEKLAQMKQGDMRIIALVYALVGKQHDAVVEAESDLTAEEIAQQYLKHKYGEGQNKSDPMPEKLFMIEAEPDAIRTLLIKSDCTLAPVLQGALLAVGRQLIIDGLFRENGNLAQAVRQADIWMKAVDAELIENNLRLNGMTKRHNRILRQENKARRILVLKDHQKKEDGWQELWNKKISNKGIPGFTPMKKLEEQGRPDLEQSLKDAGLRGYATNGDLSTLAEDQPIYLQELLPEAA